ncbi:MAG: hypothetical protein KTR15_09415 [Phycisphaeraceae bacterium]|nr:hypothetical protein [Phycisphaeraceae bacterium]
MITEMLANTILAQSDPKQKVLVDRGKLEEVSKSITDGVVHDMPWELLLVGIGATLMVIVVISIRRWWLSRHNDPTPTVLFIAIARKTGLGWRDRYLLWRIAKTFDLPTPIALMLSRGALRHYTDLYLSNRASGSRRAGQRLAQIESALFG